jgi:hypothetical protein
MKILYSILVICFFIGCGSRDKIPSSIDVIAEEAKRISLFQNLLRLTGNSIPKQQLNDSLAFLVLPVQASCPACRKKAIDSIIKYQDRMPAGRYIIISARAGRKTISSYFREEDADLPELENRLFLDSTNQAGIMEMYNEKPTIYYSLNQKVYKRVGAIPVTVKQDLQEFFSGYRTDNNN